MVMVNRAIEFVCSGGKSLLRTRAIRAKIVNQSPSPNPHFSRCEMSMKIMTRKEVSVHGIHMAVNHVTGPVGARKRISWGEFIETTAKLKNGFEDGTIRQVSERPIEEFIQKVIELLFGGGMVNLPNFGAEFKVYVTKSFPTTADFDEGV